MEKQVCVNACHVKCRVNSKASFGANEASILRLGILWYCQDGDFSNPPLHLSGVGISNRLWDVVQYRE
jgi:hypothetical protein